jgi:hypothetical protein
MIESISQLGLAFFGLSYDNAPESRAAIFTQIHQIVFHGKGGYDWHTVYNMPIWLRRFTFNQISQYYEDQIPDPSNKSQGNKTVIGSDGKIKSPEFLKKPTQSKKPISFK